MKALVYPAWDTLELHDIPSAGEIVERIVAEAEALLRDRLPSLVRVS